MLLNELKRLTEIDQRPLADAIASAQSYLSGGSASSARVDKDVDQSMTPLIDSAILHVDPTITQSEIARTLDTPEKVEAAVKDLQAMKTILKRLQRKFSTGIQDLEIVKKIAKAEKHKDATRWLDSLETDVSSQSGTLVQAYEADVKAALARDRQNIIDAITKTRVTETWADLRIKHIKELAYAKNPNVTSIKRYIEMYHAFIGTMLLNTAHLLRMVESLRKKAPAKP
jgi:hypothetical protein